MSNLNLFVRSVLRDKIVTLYLKNAPSQSISEDDYADLIFYYSRFKEHSLIEWSWIDELVREMQTWKSIKIEF